MAELTARQRVAAGEYTDFVAAHPTADRVVRAYIEDVLLDAGRTFDGVTSRLKTLPSFLAKIEKVRSNGEYFFPAGFADAYDVIGVRITTFHSTEIPEVRRILEQAFTVERVVDKTAQTQVSGGFGYGSLHLICRCPGAAGEAGVPNPMAELAGYLCEIQIRTVLQHAWAEFEHDIRYKNDLSNPEVDRAFTLAAGLIELADQQFDKIAAIVDKSTDAQAEADDAVLTPDILPGVLTMLLGPAFPRSRPEYYRYAVEMLLADGVTTVGELREVLAPGCIARVREVLHPDYPPGQVRIVDDCLLATFGRGHIRRTVDIGDHARTRSGRLGTRFKRLNDAGVVAS